MDVFGSKKQTNRKCIQINKCSRKSRLCFENTLWDPTNLRNGVEYKLANC